MRMNGPEDTPYADCGYSTSAVTEQDLELKAKGTKEYRDSDLNEDTAAVRNEHGRRTRSDE